MSEMGLTCYMAYDLESQRNTSTTEIGVPVAFVVSDCVRMCVFAYTQTVRHVGNLSAINATMRDSID